MFQQIISIFLLIILAVCVIGLFVCFGALGIIWLSKYSAFFLKLYLYFFEREDYNTYKEVKEILKSGGTVPIYSGYTDIQKQEGLYFLVMQDGVSIWRGKECCLVDFHQFLLDELIKIGNLEKPIQVIREIDFEYMKDLKERIKQLEKEIAERKAELSKIDTRLEEFNAKDNA